MTLNETERLVVNCQIMRLHESEALAYLKANGHEISKTTYWRIRARLKAENLKQAFEVAKNFPYLHMERLNEVELIRQEMWRNYHLEQQPFKKARILQMLLELQPVASAYAEATKDIMEGEFAKPAQQEGYSLPEQGSQEEPTATG